jgi:hypothetical protein
VRPGGGAAARKSSRSRVHRAASLPMYSS